MTGPVPQPGILDISPYVGGESKAPGIDNPAKLSANENPLGPSPKAIEAYLRAAQELHRYPDGHATALRDAIGRQYGLDPARIVCGTGSGELLSLLAQGYAGPGDEVLYSQHGFLTYPIIAKSVGATPIAVPERELTANIDAMLAAVSPRTRMVFLANPNNPTGSYVPNGDIERLLAALPSTVLFVLDSAYAEYVDAPDYSPGHDWVDRYPNVVVTHTFSKIYGLGSARLGWAYCPAPIADVLNRFRPPFNVNAPAVEAAIAVLEDRDYVARSKAHNDQWRAWLADRLSALGFTVHPSVANFLLVSFRPYDAEEVMQFLKGQGVLVRQMGGYGLPDCLRITIGTEDELARLMTAIEAYLGRNARDGDR